MKSKSRPEHQIIPRVRVHVFFGVTVRLLHVPIQLAVGFEDFAAYFADKLTSTIRPVGSPGTSGALGRAERILKGLHRRHFKIKWVC